MEQARDASDELVWQDTPEGRKPQMVRTAYGAVEWIEEQKNWIAEDMEKNIGCPCTGFVHCIISILLTKRKNAGYTAVVMALIHLRIPECF